VISISCVFFDHAVITVEGPPQAQSERTRLDALHGESYPPTSKKY